MPDDDAHCRKLEDPYRLIWRITSCEVVEKPTFFSHYQILGTCRTSAVIREAACLYLSEANEALADAETAIKRIVSKSRPRASQNSLEDSRGACWRSRRDDLALRNLSGIQETYVVPTPAVNFNHAERQNRMFVFFSNRLGCLGSIVVSAVGTLLVLWLIGVL